MLREMRIRITVSVKMQKQEERNETVQKESCVLLCEENAMLTWFYDAKSEAAS